MIHPDLADLAEDIDSLNPYPGNPRRGRISAISDSLRLNGQYRPIVANRPGRVVLAGNHTLAAARQLGWGKVAVWWVDVDEDTARRIVLADNRIADLGSYDQAVLVALLESLPELSGTGYSEVDLARLKVDEPLTFNDASDEVLRFGDLTIPVSPAAFGPWQTELMRIHGRDATAEVRRRLGL